MVTVDDAQLLQMSQTRVQQLFPVLRRADSLQPLVYLLALLPGIFAFYHRTFDADSALWGLHALDMLPVNHPMPGGDGTAAPHDLLRYQPPLGPWLTSLMLTIMGPANSLALLSVSYLATAGLVGTAYGLVRQLEGSRTAFLAALLIALHPAIIGLTQSAAPTAPGLMLAMGTLWGYVAHLQSTSTIVSLPLLLAGMALGGCLLAGGPLALLVLVTLLIFTIGRREKSPRTRTDRHERSIARKGHGDLIALLILTLLAGAVGGWWVILMAWQHGRPFFDSWFLGISADATLPTTASTATSGPFGFLTSARFVWPLGLFAGYSLLGAGRAIRKALRSPSSAEAARAQFLLSWAGAAMFVCLVTLWTSSRSLLISPPVVAFLTGLWYRWLLLAALVLAAQAINAITLREVGVGTAIGIAYATLVASFVTWLAIPAEPLQLITIIQRSLLLLLLGVAVVWLGTSPRVRDSRQRLIVSCVLAGLFLFHAIEGLRTSRHERPDDQALAGLRREVAARAPLGTVIVASEQPLPPQLLYTLRSLAPAARLLQRESFDAAMAIALEDPEHTTGPMFLLDWAKGEARPAAAPMEGFHVEAVTVQQTFRERPLNGVILTRETATD